MKHTCTSCMSYIFSERYVFINKFVKFRCSAAHCDSKLKQNDPFGIKHSPPVLLKGGCKKSQSVPFSVSHT